MEHKQLTYSELLYYVKNYHITTPWQAVCWMMGFQDAITRTDFNNIAQLFMDGILY